MRWFNIIPMVVALLLMTSISACGNIVPENPMAAAPSGSAVTATEAAEADEETTNSDDSEFPLEDLDSDAFDNPTEINNQYFPLTPGMEYVFDGFTEEGSNKIPHSIIFTVTDLTKEVAGVQTVVAYILDYSAGELVEAEIAFYAQDNDGNVWFMGEYPEVYELGEIVEAPAWIPGFKGARAGIVMKADPQPGTASYAQGWGPAVNWADRAQVVALGEQTCVPAGCYQDVLVTEEFGQYEPDAFQVKTYAPGVGNVKVTWKGEDTSRETLELTTLTELNAEAMAEVRAAALELEESALENSKEVYAASQPLEYVPDPATVAEFRDLDITSFSNPTEIDNKWMPMQPGTRWIYEGTAVDDEGNNFTRRIEFTVTDLTKEIAGVRTVVAWIVDYNDDEVIEKELAFYAQDREGNVWYFGEHPEEFEAGEFVKASPWIHGIENAKAGIKMMTEPALGIPKYYQGWGPAVDWSDYGQVDQMGTETCVPVDCYQDVLVIAESSLGEMDAYQLKYYAPGVGEVRVGWKGEDATQEELELVKYEQLSPQALADIRAEALAVEKHAFEVSDVYKQTSPAEYPVGTPAIDVELAQPSQAEIPQGSGSEIVVYASDLPESALFELDFLDDPGSPGSRLIGLPNNGDELDPPPENDPHVTFTAQVQSGQPYRCWIHMKVGMPKGKSQANVIWVQFSGAIDQNDTEVFKPGSDSYMTAEGPGKEGWAWVACEMAGTDSLVQFQTGGEVTIRLQAGMEGVGFDQFILSPTDFLNGPPEQAVVER